MLRYSVTRAFLYFSAAVISFAAKENCGMNDMAFSSLGNSGYIELNMATEDGTCFLAKAVQDPATKYGKTPA